MLEIFNNLFMSIAEQMGVRLQNTAHSVNIKERLDFSCALFDADGNLIANAPHMPVHLGSMGESIKMVIAAQQPARMQPGDVYVLNDPYHGGTHLPDVTVVTPGVRPRVARDPRSTSPRAATTPTSAGITPGSMPAVQHAVEEEGVLIDNWLLVAGRRAARSGDTGPAATGAVPVAQPRAQPRRPARAGRGQREGRRGAAAMVEHFGLDVVRAYMGHVQDNAEEAVRRVIAALHDGSFTYELDNGARHPGGASVSIARRGRAEIDFTGTSRAAGRATSTRRRPSCMAAVLYVFRTLVDDDIPLNAGCLKPLTSSSRPGSMLAPRYPAAVAAGNVETSQAVTGALYAALGVHGRGLRAR